MSIAKSSSLTNSYRHVTLAIVSYQNKQLTGMLYHESQNQGIAFFDLMDMVWTMEGIFEEIRYPMRSMDPRDFKAIRKKPNNQMPVTLPEKDGVVLATFQIRIRYRYYASWQGTLTLVDRGESIEFESFLELAQKIDEVLEPDRQGTKIDKYVTSCKLAIDENDNSGMSGALQSLELEHRLDFKSTMGLMHHMTHLFGKPGLNQRKPKTHALISNQAFNAYRNLGKKATFLIQVRFYENHTWQGTVLWKEAGKQISFRSFLELMMLIDITNDSRDSWNRLEKTKKSIWLP